MYITGINKVQKTITTGISGAMVAVVASPLAVAFRVMFVIWIYTAGSRAANRISPRKANIIPYKVNCPFMLSLQLVPS